MRPRPPASGAWWRKASPGSSEGGEGPRAETDPLDTAEGPWAVTVKGVMALEDAVLNTPGIDGLVLRYGRFYGPGTWTLTPQGTSPLHVDAAAQVARLAVTRGEPGIYNVAEDDGTVAHRQGARAFGFDPGFRCRSAEQLVAFLRGGQAVRRILRWLAWSLGVVVAVLVVAAIATMRSGEPASIRRDPARRASRCLSSPIFIIPA